MKISNVYLQQVHAASASLKWLKANQLSGSHLNCLGLNNPHVC